MPSKCLTRWLICLCTLLLLLWQIFREQRSISSILNSPKINEHSTLIRESSFVYAGREYRFRYSSKLFLEVADGVVPAASVENNSNSTTASPPRILYGVSSFGPEIERRDLIRRTWGSIDDSHVFFMIANPPKDINGTISVMIMEELNKHGDLIWLDIPESYRNALTPKTFAFMYFTNHHYLARMEDGLRAVIDPSGNSATTVEYIFKTDSDVFVNTTEMSMGLEAKGRPEYYGLIAGSRQIHRTGKFLTTWDEYPREAWPAYGGGWGYAISTQSAFFRFREPIKTPTTGMSHQVLSNMLATEHALPNFSESVFDYPLPPMVSVDKLAQISNNSGTMSNSCTEQVMASMLPMPWEDVGSGLLREACNVSIVDDAYCEWRPEIIEPYMHGGNTVPVKLLHDVEPQWFEALMYGDPLDELDPEKFKQLRKVRKKCKK